MENGSVGYVSVSNSKKINLQHNRRDDSYMDLEEASYYAREEKYKKEGTYPADYEVEHFRIDRSKSYLNETLIDEDWKEIYERTFQSAATAYDKKERHKERKRGNYYEYIKEHQGKKKNPKLAYELVFQIGGSEDSTDPITKKKDGRYHALTEEEKLICAEALKDFLKDFQKRNPEVIVSGAWLHMDETSPHLHIDYIPVCHSKTGMKVKNSRMGALDEQEQRLLDAMPDGKEKEAFKEEMKTNKFRDNRLTRWEERERKALQKCAFEHGLVVETTRKPTKEIAENVEAHRARKRFETTLKTTNEKTQELLENYCKGMDDLNALEDTLNGIKTDIQDYEKEAKAQAQEEANTIISGAQEEAQNIAFAAYEERDEAIKAKEEAEKELAQIQTKTTTVKEEYEQYKAFCERPHSYNDYPKSIAHPGKRLVPETPDLDNILARMDDANNLEKDIAAEKAKNRTLETENKNLEKELKDLQKDLPKRADIDFEDEYMTNRDISGLIRSYSYRLPATDRKNVIKNLERLDKLDSFLEHSFNNRHLNGLEIIEQTKYTDYKDEIRDLYNKVLTYQGRGEIYEDLPKIWGKIKADNSKYWREYKAKYPKGYKQQAKIDAHFLKSTASAGIGAIKELYAMQEQAQEGYDER